jgi:hypothetical protein
LSTQFFLFLSVEVSEKYAPASDNDVSLRKSYSRIKKLAGFLLLAVIALTIALVVTVNRLKELGKELSSFKKLLIGL